jgi:hypothetical protein
VRAADPPDGIADPSEGPIGRERGKRRGQHGDNGESPVIDSDSVEAALDKEHAPIVGRRAFIKVPAAHQPEI